MFSESTEIPSKSATISYVSFKIEIENISSLFIKMFIDFPSSSASSFEISSVGKSDSFSCFAFLDFFLDFDGVFASKEF